MYMPGRVAHSAARLTNSQRSRVKNPVRPHTFVSPSADSKRAVVSYWRKYVHENILFSFTGLCPDLHNSVVNTLSPLVNRLGGLSISRKSVFG